LEGRLAEAEDDYDRVVMSNIRLVLLLRQQGVELPSVAELVERYPLTHYRDI